jgi:hypothetical protein
VEWLKLKALSSNPSTTKKVSLRTAWRIYRKPFPTDISQVKKWDFRK